MLISRNRRPGLAVSNSRQGIRCSRLGPCSGGGVGQGIGLSVVFPGKVRYREIK